jgi:hypothetical protein
MDDLDDELLALAADFQEEIPAKQPPQKQPKASRKRRRQ